METFTTLSARVQRASSLNALPSSNSAKLDGKLKTLRKGGRRQLLMLDLLCFLVTLFGLFFIMAQGARY